MEDMEGGMVDVIDVVVVDVEEVIDSGAQIRGALLERDILPIIFCQEERVMNC